VTAPSSAKRIPALSVVPPPIPVRNHVNDNNTAMNSNNEKSRKPSDQPPELPPKTARVMAAAGKFASPNNHVTSSDKPNPIINKENQQLATTESETASATHEEKLVQRNKTKANRRKMTEEEAVKELG
jgi:hypothetical protein